MKMVLVVLVLMLAAGPASMAALPPLDCLDAADAGWNNPNLNRQCMFYLHLAGNCPDANAPWHCDDGLPGYLF